MAEKDQRRQDEYFKSNIHNLIGQAVDRGYPRFSLFLEEREVPMAEEILRHNRWENYLFSGGVEGCERVMLGVFPEEFPPDAGMFPITALEIRHKAPDVRLSHRDYLGALMSLQIKREHIGDIVVKEDSAVVFLSDSVAEFVRQNLDRIGRCSVSITDADRDSVEIRREFQTISGTVSSLRLDCIVAMLLNKSRRIAEEALQAGRVKVNGSEVQNGAKQLSPGDVISLRGSGKFILGDDCKRTKKDRLFITIQKLV